MTEPDRNGDENRDDPWSTFKSWHRDRAFWKDTYSEFLAGLLIALVIYLVAAAAGLVSKQPLIWIGVFSYAGAVVVFVVDVVIQRRRRRGQRQRRFRITGGHVRSLVGLVLVAIGAVVIALQKVLQ